jgi:8-amino-7-oxononanoate synthase
MSRFDSLFDHALAEAQASNRRRRLRPLEPLDGGRVRLDSQVLIDLCSNDYLGLSRHPALIERSREWASRFGAGSGASRLVRGSFHAHHAVEGKLAALKGAEAALLFASGWQANAGVVPALVNAAADAGPPQVFADFLAHSSLRVGCRAAGVRPVRFRHNDLEQLEALLTEQSESPGRRFILTESVFSMDGDRVDLDGLLRIAERWDAFVYLDEAHATGVLGPMGMGLSAATPGRVDLAMGTFSKAMGSFGAYVAGSRSLIDYLTGACSGFVYTTAPPPPVLGAIDAALDLVPGMEAERTHLLRLADRLRAGLKEAGLDVGPSTTQIVPAILGGEAETLALSARLEAEGVLAVAIRPPTVPEGASRIRFSLSAAHSDADVERVIALLAPMARRRTA